MESVSGAPHRATIFRSRHIIMILIFRFQNGNAHRETHTKPPSYRIERRQSTINPCFWRVSILLDISWRGILYLHNISCRGFLPPANINMTTSIQPAHNNHRPHNMTRRQVSHSEYIILGPVPCQLKELLQKDIMNKCLLG